MALSAATKLRRFDRFLLESELRSRALERLYERRSAVDNLISAMERYQEQMKVDTSELRPDSRVSAVERLS
jgi:hypothetical protein